MPPRSNPRRLLQLWMLILLLIYLWRTMNPQNTKLLKISSNPKQIFILAGQSNMAGRGGVSNKIWDGFVPQECYPNPGIQRLNAELRWEEAKEPLHADIDFNKTCGVGPGMVFANKIFLKKFTCEGIGLVPCAIGGTSINEWSRGSKLYNHLITRATAAVNDGGNIEAIVWYQGERDTINQEDADSYKVKLEILIEDLRSDLQLPKLPFFQVVLASAEGQFMEKVREAQLGVEIPKVISVDAKGLPLEPDGLHLSTAGQVYLGEMLADAFLTFRHAEAKAP